MKTTGIIRGIDNLGRFVLPKEIRDNLNLGKYAELEIFLSDEGDIVLKKYSPLSAKFEMAGFVCEGLSKTLNCPCFITTDEEIVAGSSSIKPYVIGSKILPSYLNEISKGITILNCGVKKNNLTNIVNETDAGITAQIAQPIISKGKCIGSIVVFSKERDKDFNLSEALAVQTAAKIIISISE